MQARGVKLWQDSKHETPPSSKQWRPMKKLGCLTTGMFLRCTSVRANYTHIFALKSCCNNLLQWRLPSYLTWSACKQYCSWLGELGRLGLTGMLEPGFAYREQDRCLKHVKWQIAEVGTFNASTGERLQVNITSTRVRLLQFLIANQVCLLLVSASSISSITKIAWHLLVSPCPSCVARLSLTIQMYVQEEGRNTDTDDLQLRESDTVGNAEPDGATLHPLPSQISTGKHCEVAQGEEIDTKPKLCPEVKSLLEKEEENRKANKPLRSLELRKIVSDALSLQQKFEGVYQVSSCNSNDGHYAHPYPTQALRPTYIYIDLFIHCAPLCSYINCHPNKLIKSSQHPLLFNEAQASAIPTACQKITILYL